MPQYGDTKHALRHNGLGFATRSRKVQRLPIRFNSGPTQRHAITDLILFIFDSPEVWDRI